MNGNITIINSGTGTMTLTNNYMNISVIIEFKEFTPTKISILIHYQSTLSLRGDPFLNKIQDLQIYGLSKVCFHKLFLD